MPNVMPSLFLAGVPELQAMLNEMGDALLGAAVKGMRKAAQPIIKDAKRRITIGWGYGSGQLKRSIGVLYAKVYKRQQRAKLAVGSRRGFSTATKTERTFDGTRRKGRIRIRKRKHDPKYIAHLVEFGHRIAVGGKLKTGGTGVLGGTVKPMPFLRPAFDTYQSQAISVITAHVRERLLKLRAKRALSFARAA